MKDSLPRCKLLGIVKLAGQRHHPALEFSQPGMHLLPVSFGGLLRLQDCRTASTVSSLPPIQHNFH